VVDVILELVFHEVLCKLASVAEALKPTVHVACISQILESDHTPSPAKVLLFEVELLEGRGSPPEVLLLDLALVLMVLPVIPLTLLVTVLHCSALAELQLFSLSAFLVGTSLNLGIQRGIFALSIDHIEVPFSDSIKFIQNLSISHRFADVSTIIVANLAVTPQRSKLQLEAFPIFLPGDLNPEIVFMQGLILLEFSNFDPLEMNLSKDIVRFVNEGNVVSLDVDATVSVLEESPALLWYDLVVG
jgi:hypothetical protein